jgi:hypothetical protein
MSKRLKKKAHCSRQEACTEHQHSQRTPELADLSLPETKKRSLTKLPAPEKAQKSRTNKKPAKSTT